MWNIYNNCGTIAYYGYIHFCFIMINETWYNFYNHHQKMLQNFKNKKLKHEILAHACTGMWVHVLFSPSYMYKDIPGTSNNFPNLYFTYGAWHCMCRNARNCSRIICMCTKWWIFLFSYRKTHHMTHLPPHQVSNPFALRNHQ